MKPTATARTLNDTEFSDWNRFAGSEPTGSLYSRTEYLDALCTAIDGRFRVLAVHQGDVLYGGIALYERTGNLGTYVSPRLLLYYNGPVLRQHETKYPSEQTARHLKALSVLEEDICKIGYDSVVFKPRSPLNDLRPFLERGWRPKHGYTYVVAIDDLERTRARIEQNLRRLIDRCARTDMVMTEDDDFDSFFRLHSQTMERVDFHVYLPAPNFRKFYETLARQNLARLFHARLPNGQAIATQLVLLGHPVTHTVCAGADPEHIKSGVSAFLRWKVFERLSVLGHLANDLTDAALNPVTHFKSQLGGTLEPWVELSGPESRRYQWGMRANRAKTKVRGGLRGIVHRGRGLLQRDKSEARDE